jgi:hypothetical protein
MRGYDVVPRTIVADLGFGTHLLKENRAVVITGEGWVGYVRERPSDRRHQVLNAAMS